MSMEVFECPFCGAEFFGDYQMEEIWYEPCNDGSFNAYVTLLCPMCGDVSVPV